MAFRCALTPLQGADVDAGKRVFQERCSLCHTAAPHDNGGEQGPSLIGVLASGAAAFPSDYIGDAFVAFHGSWNRSLRTGYKVVRVRMKDGRPTGDYQDFLTGFVIDAGHVWGRPGATVVLGDGSLLVSDDAANQIYRITYRR